MARMHTYLRIPSMGTMPCHEYRIAGELRRCCWYGILSAFPLAAAFFVNARFVQNRGPVDVFVGCVLYALLVAAMVVPLRWRVRIDQHGISRRLLFRWDLWPWAALASGRVRKLHPFTLHDPERPWWRRRLRLGCMASSDIQEVIAMVNTHYKLPPPPDIPAALTIKYAFRCSAAFDRNGIHLMIRDIPHNYLWRDLRDVHIVRMDPLRRDFKSLVITLPDQEIKLKLVTHEGGTSPSWRGATAEELNEYLLQCVPADCIHVSIAGQQLAKREYIERQLEEAKKSTRAFAIMMVVFFPLILGLLVWMAMDDGIWKAAVMGAMCVVCPGSVMVFLYRAQCKQISELMDSLNGTAVTSTGNPVPESATEQNREVERLHAS